MYQDDCIIAINKPHGLLVHHSKIACDATECALQLLRDQIGQKVWPIHRLDRKTGGLLLFALNTDIVREIQKQFMEHKVKKRYVAIVRGFAPDIGEIDYPLKNEKGVIQEAFTKFKTLDKTELDIPFGKHPTIRYSLVEALPETGRMHQIRKHFAHLRHPIIADRPHGCNKQNRLFKEKWNMNTMLLHSANLEIFHPVENKEVKLSAPLQEEFCRISEILGFNLKKSIPLTLL